ncbi:MAG TPA: hypothetical protein V6C72_11950 [Chroococcales cyanobacterium]
MSVLAGLALMLFGIHKFSEPACYICFGILLVVLGLAGTIYNAKEGADR